MNNFFSNFDQVLYNFDFGENTQRNILMTNFTRNIQFNEISKILEYNRYYINDSEKPDTTSYALYDNPYKHWILYLINPELKKGWPLSEQEIDKHIENLYGKLSFIVDRNETIYYLPLGEDDDIKNVDIFIRVNEEYVKTNSAIRGFDASRRALIVTYDPILAQKIETNGVIFIKPNENYSSENLLKWYDNELNPDRIPALNNDGYYRCEISKASSSLLKNGIYEFTNKGYRDGIIQLDNTNSVPEFITFSENIIRENEKNKFIKVLPKSTIPIVETEYLNMLRDANR